MQTCDCFTAVANVHVARGWAGRTGSLRTDSSVSDNCSVLAVQCLLNLETIINMSTYRKRKIVFGCSLVCRSTVNTRFYWPILVASQPASIHTCMHMVIALACCMASWSRCCSHMFAVENCLSYRLLQHDAVLSSSSYEAEIRLFTT